MTTFVFPGQGSQARSMGSALFEEFNDIVQKANQILGYDLVTLCLEDPNDELNKTEFTQPALYTVNALYYYKKLKETDQPNFVAGHSLGEYNALLAAHVFDFETGLKLVQKRGQLMSEAKGGGMAAVIGLTSDAIENVLAENALTHLSIANYNSPKQIVITGLKDQIIQAQPIFEQAGATMYIPLKVSGAFHSPFMQQAKEQFADFLQKFTFSPPSLTVIANVDAKPYQADRIADYLANQITHSVRWTQTIEYLLGQDEKTFVEVGPGKVLAGLIRRIQQGQ